MVERISAKTIYLGELISKEFIDQANRWNESKGTNYNISEFKKRLTLWYLNRIEGLYVQFGSLPGTPGEVLGTCHRDDRGFYTIMLSELLLQDSVSYETLKSVALHEFAHYVDSYINGEFGHGKSFKEICKFLGVSDDESHMKESIYKEAKTSNSLEKIKKLLALSESPNLHEAQSALLKAKELMREYGIERVDENEEDDIYRVALKHYRYFTAEVRTIQDIVSEISNTWILLSYTHDDQNVLYAHGTKTECEIASYLYSYLERELEAILQKEKKESKDNSRSFRTSFYHGVRYGFKERIRTQERENIGKKIVPYRKENEYKAKTIAYPESRFSTTRRSFNIGNTDGYFSGQRAGASLKIRNGISSGSSKNQTLYLN